jgi:hypothetical protein
LIFVICNVIVFSPRLRKCVDISILLCFHVLRQKGAHRSPRGVTKRYVAILACHFDIIQRVHAMYEKNPQHMHPHPQTKTRTSSSSTNPPTIYHFDLDSVEWLEAFLRNQNIPMAIVSHNGNFLDQVCAKTVDAEGDLCTES